MATSKGDAAAAAVGSAEAQAEETVAHPQKRHYRQRAHSNPLSDHSFDVPLRPDAAFWRKHFPDSSRAVEYVDVGCGYGGLLVALADLAPDTLILGLEIRVKVTDFVRDRISALRMAHPGKYQNISVERTNAMKFFPNLFRKAQLSKLFFLYPDPHFKKKKYKRRIINQGLLSEYAFALRPGGLVYTITDVVDMHHWMVDALEKHPLFERVSDEDLSADAVVPLLYNSTEEGKKVFRNKLSGQNHGDGDVRLAVYRRRPDPSIHAFH